MDISQMLEQTLELEEKHELTNIDLVPKAQPTNRKSLMNREPLLGWTNPLETYTTPTFNQLADVHGVARVACARNDLKVTIGRPPKGKTQMRPADISRYNNPNAAPIMPLFNNLFPSQLSPFEAY